MQDGGDPVLEGRTKREALTIAAFIERFIARHAKQKLRSWQAYENLLRRDVLPVIGERPASDVTRAQIANLLDKVADRAPVVSNRLHTVLSSLFSWGVSEGLVDMNPVAGLRKRATEVSKDRVLTDDEIRRMWAASADSLGPAYRDIMRLILLTGQRPGEVAGMTREEVELDAARWVLPLPRVKNNRQHVVPLVGEALAIVTRLTSATKRGPLLVTKRGVVPSSIDVAKAAQRLRAEGFETPFTAHDLRRTAATLMGRLDIDQMTIARVLNHASTTRATITGSVYDRHSYEPQMRRALEALDAEVRRIVSGEPMPMNVLSMRRGA